MKRRAIAGFACCALFSAAAEAAATAATAPVAPAEAAKRSIDIPADDLVACLELLAKQSGLEFIYDANRLKGVKARGVSGEMTPKAAVVKLLEGTDLALTEHGGAMLIAPAIDEIVVTGTHIRGEEPVGSVLIVYTRADIEQSGSATLDQFARNMAENFSSVDSISNQSSSVRFSPTHSSNGINAFQGASFNLRGLGPAATLTLLNGQRLAPGGLDGSFTDISQIPLSAVDHIEVLPDGASAIYGADAVAGVVNIITRKDWTGAQTTVRYGGSTEGGADEAIASQLLGRSWSTGNVLLNYEIDDQHGLDASQRAYIPPLGGPYSLIPDNRRNSFFISGNQELAAATSLSGDLLYSDRKFSDASTFGGTADLPVRRTAASGSAQQLSATAALDHALAGDWHAQLSANYSRNRQLSNATTLIEGSGNLGDVIQQAASPSIVDANAMIQGSLLSIPGGPVRAAFGASSRAEKYDSIDSQTTSGRTTASGEPTSRREVLSVYGEIVAPLIGEDNAVVGYRRVEVSLAGRFDHYSDFGFTANPKLGLSWEIIRGVYFKGTFGTSFQAPLLSQVHMPLSIETQLLADGPTGAGSTDTLVLQGGNLNLIAEKSRSFTAGFDLKPATVPGYTLGVSFFHVKFASKITAPPSSSGGNYSLSDPLLTPFIIHDPSVEMVQGYFTSPEFSGDLAGLGPSAVRAVFDDRLTNLAVTVESGVDVTTQYAIPLGRSRLNLSLGVERLIENANRTVYFAPVVSLLNSFAEPPKWKGRAGALWTEGPLTASASLNYVNAYWNSLFTPPQTIGSWTTGDVYLSYRTGEGLPLPLRQLTVALSIANIADVHPPRTQIPASFTVTGESAIPFDPANASPVGRTISMTLGKRW